MKDTSKFNKKLIFLTLNVLRFFALPVSFFGNFAGSSNFSKRQNFFRKYHLCFERKIKFRTFWGILQIQSLSKANLQPLSNCKLFMIFFERPIYFLLKSPKFQLWTFWKFMLFQSHSRAKLRPLAILKKTQDFSWKTRLFFYQKTKVFNSEHFENSCFSSRIIRQFF